MKPVNKICSHAVAIRYILRTRGARQLYSRAPKSLWCFANQRLLAHKLLLREEPDPIQIELSNMLDAGRPDIHVGADVLKITTLCAESKMLVQNRESSEDLAQQAEDLLGRMRGLFHDMDAWTHSLANLWTSTMIDAAPIARYRQTDHPLASFTCPSLLNYSDNWIAYLWTFHTASQVVLRESVIELIDYRAQMRIRDVDASDKASIRQQEDEIEALAGSIIRSFPRLMGLTDDAGEVQAAQSQGIMAGRFLALFAMNIVREAAHASPEHKLTASNVIQWVSKRHTLS